MSNFSSIACYSALSVCSKEDVISAYARMVASLVQKNRYECCEAEKLSADFEKMYGFAIPYHPMRTIMDQCVQLNYFTFNSTMHSFFPVYDRIDGEDFLTIIEKKDAEYKKLLDQFGAFLTSEYNIHSSPEDLDERIRAFIERYGIKSKTDREILWKVKDDYLFAEFMVHCEEHGHPEILDYLDEYTSGVALSEIFTYSNSPEKLTARNTHVYLDTGLLFKLFGIDSTNHANSYTQYIQNMQRIGIKVMVYDHTVTEMIGIIEGSKHWIGNPDYDATLSSEATYFFVSNNWTVNQVDELSVNIRTRLTDEFNIKIDKMAYPKAEDIHTPYEANIYEMIVGLYTENDPNRNVDDIRYTIDQDAKSIFFTLHKNQNKVAYHINDVENIFITTNRSLARVGYNLSQSISQSNEVFIPSVMNDIKWGTLIWFNSPTLISSINRPRLVSAAYAAFRPNPELTKRLNDRLIQLEAEGKITPEQCYLLKVHPLAQHLLARKTMNDPERFVDATPLEIIQELGREGFEKGSASRQFEVDELTRKNETYKFKLAKEKQEKIISDLKKESLLLSTQINSVKGRIKKIGEELDVLSKVKSDIDAIVNRYQSICKNIIITLALVFIVFCVYIGFEYEWLFGVITSLLPAIMWVVSLWFGKKITYATLQDSIENRVRTKQNDIRRYSDNHVQALKKELSTLLGEQTTLQNKQNEVFSKLSTECGKIDNFSIDTSVFEATSV